MGSMKFKRAAGALATAVLGGWLSVANAVGDMPGGPKVNGLNLQDPVTKIAADQHWIHWFLIWICTGIFIVVFGAMFYAIWPHRKPRGHRPRTSHGRPRGRVAGPAVPSRSGAGGPRPAP